MTFGNHPNGLANEPLEFHIGTLVGAPLARPAPEASDDDPSAPFLDPKRWKSVVLSDVKTINHDSALFRFDLQGAEQPLGLPTGQHTFVRLKRKDTGELVQRAYTPVSREDAVGHIDFLIKWVAPWSRE
jgi:nitrate reductase (NAD(P)H)